MYSYSSTITYDLPFITSSLSFIKGLIDECQLPGIFTTYVSLLYVCNSMCMLMSVIVCACMCSLFVHGVECICTRVYNMYICLVFVHGACVCTRVCV